ncbi:MAG: thioredoxin family protein [Anaerolineae bacterium]|nr:thioredoxin family protein [Anaerolineae bacterium]
MALLNDRDAEMVRDHFAKNLEGPVTLVCFTQTVACQFCRETKQILEEVADLSDKITLEVHNFVEDRQVADQYGVDKIPATVVLGSKDYGVRFYGIPSGYEFTSLIAAIVMVSRGKSNLSDATLKALEDLEETVDIQVFITPTCPYCPRAVELGHRLAVASDKITSAMVEAIEFPHLSQKYDVQGVPRSVFNETTHLEGAVPEPLFVAKLLQAVGKITQVEFDAMLQGMR